MATKKNGGGLSLLQGMVLDALAEGKTPRQIESITGVPAAQVYKMGLELLDSEVLLDTESKRKLQLYRLEKIIEALWTRVQANADRDDVKNLIEVMDRVSALLALNKQAEVDEVLRVSQYQSFIYISSLKALVQAFKAIAPPNTMTEDQWDSWTADQLVIAQKQIESDRGQYVA
jgi:hypothetical protein